MALRKQGQADDAQFNAKKKTYDSLSVIWAAKEQDLYTTFVKKHPNSLVSIHSINYLLIDIDYEDVAHLYAGLSPGVQASKGGVFIRQYVAQRRSTEIGKDALSFKQADALGQLIALSDFKGKYVLLDFWASWCIPCRQENPKVLEAYNKYNKKGLEILGISLDDKRTDWLKAIADDALPWKQVSDLKGWNNEVSVLYSVYSIPQNFLIDPQGKIIAKDLRGPELEAALSKIFEGK